MSTAEMVPTVSESYLVRAQRCDYILQQENTLQIITQRIAEGETVKDIARAWDIPHGRLSGWLLADETRMAAYTNAQRIHAYTLVEETVGIADAVDAESKAAVGKAKLQIETRFQVAAHHAKERYGAQDKAGGGTRVNVIVQRSQPQEPVAIAATAQEVSHGTD